MFSTTGIEVDNTDVVIDVMPLPEQADRVEQLVVKKVGLNALPLTIAVPWQSWIAVWLHMNVVAVTFVISAPEHALVVVQAMLACVLLSDTNREESQLTKAVWLHELLELLGVDDAWLDLGVSVGSSVASGSLGSLGSPPLGGGKLLGFGNFPKLKPFGIFPPLTMGATMLQALSMMPLTMLLPILSMPPIKPPPLGFGIGLHLSVGRFIFTIWTPPTLITGKILMSVGAGISTFVAVTSFWSKNPMGRTQPNRPSSVQNRSSVSSGTGVVVGVWPQKEASAPKTSTDDAELSVVVLTTPLEDKPPEVLCCETCSPPVDVYAELRLDARVSDGVVTELESEPVVVALPETLDSEPDTELDDEAVCEELAALEDSNTVVDEPETADGPVVLADVFF
jgi:hypothetical protein